MQTGRLSDGSIGWAAENTNSSLYDTRVWLHMYEAGDGKLEPSFCRVTGRAQYMYDFTGALLRLTSA